MIAREQQAAYTRTMYVAVALLITTIKHSAKVKIAFTIQ